MIDIVTLNAISQSTDELKKDIKIRLKADDPRLDLLALTARQSTLATKASQASVNVMDTNVDHIRASMARESTLATKASQASVDTIATSVTAIRAQTDHIRKKAGYGYNPAWNWWADGTSSYRFTIEGRGMLRILMPVAGNGAIRLNVDGLWNTDSISMGGVLRGVNFAAGGIAFNNYIKVRTSGNGGGEPSCSLLCYYTIER